MREGSVEEAQFIRLTETPVPKLIVTLAIPTMCSMVITAVYNMADTYFVAQLGTSAAGAVGIVFSMMAIIQAIGFNIGMGAGSLLSRLLGKRDAAAAGVYASSAMAMAVSVGAIVGAAGLYWNAALMRLLGATPNILPYAQDYARFIFLGTPVMCLAFVLNNLMRAQGKAALSTLGLSAGGVVNLLLDPLFIFGFGWGIAGAAIATLVSQCLSCAILFYLFSSGRSAVQPSWSALSPEARVYGRIFTTGFPAFCRQGLASIATVALNVSAAAYGDEAVAAMSIVGRIFMLFFAVTLGLGQGFQPVAGYNYGAGKYERVKEAYRFCIGAGTAAMTLLAAAGFWFAPQIIAAFRAEDAAVIAIGAFALRAQCAVLPLQPSIVATNMLFQSVGKPAQATFLSICRQGLYFLPLLFWLVSRYQLLGVQITQPCADALTFLSCLPLAYTFHQELDRRIAAR